MFSPIGMIGVKAMAARMLTARSAANPSATRNSRCTPKDRDASRISTPRRRPRRSAKWAAIAGAAIRIQLPAVKRSPISVALMPFAVSQTGQNGSDTPTNRKTAA